MDLSDIIPAILEGGPLVVAIVAFGVMGWLNYQENQRRSDERKVEQASQVEERKAQIAAWNMFATAQDRLIDDIERNSERKEKEAEERIAKLQKQIDEVQEQLRAKEKQIADLNELLAARQETDKGKDKTINEMRDALRSLENKYADLKKKYDALQGQYDKLSDERDEWKSKWEVLSDGVQAIQKRDTDQLNAATVEAKEQKEAKDKAA